MAKSVDMFDCDLLKAQDAFAVVAIDDYCNEIISGSSVSMLLDGEGAALIQEEGYHIFRKPESGLHSFSAGGWIYQQQDFIIDADDEKESGSGMMRIRLLPNEHYMAGRAATVIQGVTAPKQELHFVFINQHEPYRLCRDYATGEKEVAISHNSDTFLDGKLFCLQKPDGEVEEFWIEERTEGEKRYLLRYFLNGSYEQSKSILRRVYTVIADQEGYFYLPVPSEEEACEEYRCYTPLEKRTVRTGLLISGQVNILNEQEPAKGSKRSGRGTEREWPRAIFKSVSATVI